MFKKVRVFFALVFWMLITWLLLDITGVAHQYLGWMARIQFIPAILALNVAAILFILVLTLVLGRIYCSVICPLGVMQDALTHLKPQKKRRYSFSPARTKMRYAFLLLAAVILVANIGWLAGLLFPYSTYGRIVVSLLAPVYKGINNVLAGISAHYDNYLFYETEVWVRSLPAILIAFVSLALIAVLAWRNGRTWCNTVCPVGTLLGLISRHSYLRPVINTDLCNGCGQCARHCKASCIDPKNHEIDLSRCVMCGDCVDACRQNALTLTGNGCTSCTRNEKKEKTQEEAAPKGTTRRDALVSAALVAGTTLLHAQEKTTDGGFAVIEDKKKPNRQHRITPPGSLSARNLQTHCTACQLCINTCPNNVLRPGTSLDRFLQPEVSYERGYCRPECNQCSQVCPTGAIHPITIEERTAVQVGHAVWIQENCIPAKEGKPCGNCARHCPTGAIQMVPFGNKYHQGEHGRWFDADNKPVDGRMVPMIPVVNEEKCIGCGACEHLCPSRPFSAIYVEGHDVHREI